MSHKDEEQDEREKTGWTNGIRRKKLEYPSWDSSAVPLDQMARNRRLVRGLALMALNERGVHEDY